MTDFLAQAEAALQAGNSGLAYQLLVPALRDDPQNARAWYMYGAICEGFSVHSLKGKPKWWAAAAAALSRANALQPGDAMTLTALGWNLHLAGRTEAAKDTLYNAIAANPTFGLAHTNLAHVLCTLGEDAASLREARLGVHLDPDSNLTHLALAFALFFNGQWEEGWRAFEVRIPLKMPEMAGFPYPRWRGEPTGTLLLRSEQGLGDSIQMLRYLDAATERADRVILQIQRELVSICRVHWLGVEVEAMPCALPGGGVDAWCPLMSLPGLGLEAAFGPYMPFVSGHPFKSKQKCVGLVWAGDPNHDNDFSRSIALADMLPLTEVPGIEFISLQLGPRGMDEMNALGAHGLIRDMSPGLIDMRETLRVIEQLDLLISVDTAAAHLAGAAGCRTWLLLNDRGCDWRWMHERADTVWYPNHRLFRRSLNEQWSDVIARVREELTCLAD